MSSQFPQITRPSQLTPSQLAPGVNGGRKRTLYAEGPGFLPRRLLTPSLGALFFLLLGGAPVITISIGSILAISSVSGM